MCGDHQQMTLQRLLFWWKQCEYIACILWPPSRDGDWDPRLPEVFDVKELGQSLQAWQSRCGQNRQTLQQQTVQLDESSEDSLLRRRLLV
jgi:hypothetical protein